MILRDIEKGTPYESFMSDASLKIDDKKITAYLRECGIHMYVGEFG